MALHPARLAFVLILATCGNGTRPASATRGEETSSSGPEASSTTTSSDSTSSSISTTTSTGGGPIDLGARPACAAVELPGVEGGTWTVEGLVGFDLPTVDATSTWLFTPPVVVVPTAVTLTHSSGTVFTLSVPPAGQQEGLADGMARGCAPFSFGVASGDPAAASVELWTHVDPDAGEDVSWQLSAEPEFADIVASGTATVSAQSDHNAHVRVEGLEPATTYYYRFSTDSGFANNLSPTGRTRTAPEGKAERLRFGVVSCTSIFSGYFNGYRALARRPDLDGLIHVGDYTYDFPDEDELVRIPDPVPADPQTLEQWRALHAYHLADPDLRAARAAMPWIMLWDNHDVNSGDPVGGGGVQAFREWNPISPPEGAAGPEIIYRTLSFGDLLDVVVLDVLLFRDDADAPDGPDKTIMGDTQREWFHGALNDSSATWRIVANQKPVAPILGILQVLGGSTWNGFPDARARMFDRLADDGVDNVLFLSGDAHITAVTDLVTSPDDPAAYDPKTGEGAVGVEFQPASMSRGNVDEFFPDQPGLPAGIEKDTPVSNPHYRFIDTTRHGYGLIDIDPSRIRAEVWYLDILERTDVEELGAELEVRAGDGHWSR